MRIDSSLEGIDWLRAKADRAADDFDNGRTPDALRRSFKQPQHVAIARDGDRVVGYMTARVLKARRAELQDHEARANQAATLGQELETLKKDLKRF